MKRTKLKTAVVHHMTGEGRTKREAVEDARAKVDAALAGSHEPEIISHRGTAKLLWREPDGWRHATIAERDMPAERMPGGRYYPADSVLDTVRRKARSHLAQLTWVPADLTGVPAFVTDDGERGELKSYFTFQLAYRYWHDEMGKPDADAHRMAVERAAEGARCYTECLLARADNLALNTHTQHCAPTARPKPATARTTTASATSPSASTAAGARPTSTPRATAGE